MAGLADLQLADFDIIVDVEGPNSPKVHDDGTIETPTEDGGVVVQFSDYAPGGAAKDEEFGDNLAMSRNISDIRLGQVCEDLLDQIDADKKSRSEWIETRAQAMNLLGFKIEEPRADVGSSSSPLEGMSTFYDTLLSEAVLRAHATACGELLPAEGPVKVVNYGNETGPLDEQTEALQKDLNFWFTGVAREYYPDTKRMLFLTVFGGSGFKKGFHCPIKRRPTLESVDASKLIVSAGATDMQTAARITQELEMRPSIMRRMQVLGVYADIDLTPPSPKPKNAAEEAAEKISGQRTGNERPEDTPYNLYETYAEVDLDEFAPTQFKGKRVPLPYKVTIDIDSRQILELRRDWKKDDPVCLRKRTWVKYPYVEAMSFYCIGLMHMIGNLTLALSAGGRECLDAGMMANFPGLLIAKWAARQQQGKTNVRVNAGEAEIIDTGERPIGDAVMGMPYKDVTAGLIGILEALTAKGQRLAGTADLPVGEGKADVPVGTMIATIEQATKIESNVHKGMHTAQAEEMEILVRLFRERPETFWEFLGDDATMDWDEGKFLAALSNCMIQPRSDPNVPSHIHRLLKALALKQLQAQNPGLYDAKEVDKRILEGMGWQDVEALFVKPPPPGTPPPPPDPMQITAQSKIMDSQTKQQKVQLDAQQLAQEGQQQQQKMAQEQALQDKEIQKELIIHSNEHGLATAGHALDAVTAGHDAALGMADHHLNIAQAMQPKTEPDVSTPSPSP